jgi:hypothetical protein
MRITFPKAYILQHCNDIDEAFRQVLYTPELAIAFAYVFGIFLLIPIGQVFGSRSTPSYCSLLSDIRAYVLTCADLITGRSMHPLAAACLPPEPMPHELGPALADDINQPMSVLECASHRNSTFVDDNGVLALCSNIPGTLHNSVVVAFLLFGWPHKDRRSSCLAPDKWERDACSAMLYLGFLICSRTLRVIWPLYKRAELVNEIMAALSMKRPWFKPKVVASIIRKLRSASLIAPWFPTCCSAWLWPSIMPFDPPTKQLHDGGNGVASGYPKACSRICRLGLPTFKNLNIAPSGAAISASSFLQ